MAAEATGNDAAIASMAEQSQVEPVDFGQTLTKQMPLSSPEWVADPRPASEWLNVSDLPPIVNGKANSGSDVGGFGSSHSGGTQFVRADGAVHFISASIDWAVLQAYANRADKKWSMILIKGMR